jgi:hypothetical protein
MMETKEKEMNRSETYYMMKLVEKSEVPVWINKEELMRKLQELWIEHIHKEKAKIYELTSR